MGLISEEDLRLHLLRFGLEHGIRRHEGFPLGFVGLQQMFLQMFLRTPRLHRGPSGAGSSGSSGNCPDTIGAITRSVLGQTSAPFSSSNSPVPIRQVDTCLFGLSLDLSLQLGLLVTVEDGGDPPLCTKARAVDPLSLKAATHAPMVWGSRSNASLTANVVQPRAKSQSACHRSRSRGVGDRYIRCRTSLTSTCHRSRSCLISLIPNTTATRLPLLLTAAPQRV